MVWDNTTVTPAFLQFVDHCWEEVHDFTHEDQFNSHDEYCENSQEEISQV